MEQLLIRKARPGDLDTLLRFEQGVISAERPFDATLKTTDTQYYDLPQMIAADHIELLVAGYENVLVGSGYARIENSKPYLQHRQHAYLGFMYVEPAHRGKGINRMIIDALQEWARARGVTEMRLDVYYGNDVAIGAYQKQGFAKHMIEMRKALK